MPILKLAHPIYLFVRKALTVAGLLRPLRVLLGPYAGRIVSRFMANPGRPLSIAGHRMKIATGAGYPPVAMAMDRYEQETTKLFTELVKPGMVVIDVGAHVGYYSLLAARQVGPSGKVYSFEPEPSNHQLLLENIKGNGYRNIVAVRKAVSSHSGSTTLFLTALDNGRHSAYHHGLPERGSLAVETTTVDAFLDSEGWPKVDLVKVDVEGAEQDVLEGMGRLLQKSTALTLIIEFSPNLLQDAGIEPLRFLEVLNGRDFEVHCIIENKGPVAVPKEGWSTLVANLYKNQSSVNLFCTR